MFCISYGSGMTAGVEGRSLAVVFYMSYGSGMTAGVEGQSLAVVFYMSYGSGMTAGVEGQSLAVVFYMSYGSGVTAGVEGQSLAAVFLPHKLRDCLHRSNFKMLAERVLFINNFISLLEFLPGPPEPHWQRLISWKHAVINTL